MASEAGAGKNERRKSRKLTYFYLNGNLHRSLHINRGTDTITTWCYPEHRRVAYTYSDVLRRREFAFTTSEVGKMLSRGRTTIEGAIIRGDIEAPQYTYGLNENKKKFKYMWSEKDILGLHAFLSTQHRGRPRKDGLITPQRLPSAREVRAMCRQQEIVYVKRDGQFIPTFNAENM